MSDLSQLSPESALRTVLLVAVTGWAAWWIVGLAVAVIDRRTAARIGPPLLRALLVAGTVAATVTPAQANQSSPAGSLDGLPMPQRPLISIPTPTPTPSAAPAIEDRVHIVKPGESLWTIVRDRSPAWSSPQIAMAVTAWHDANRDLIGPDPDLIQPGQRLVPPGAS